MEYIIIGAGAAGMLCAITAGNQGSKVLLVEQNNIVGKKMLITGKGRCNITNAKDMPEFFGNILKNEKFLIPAFSSYTNKDIIEFLEKNGCKTKVERGNRVFPVSDKSKSVVDVFEAQIQKMDNVKLSLNTKLVGIESDVETIDEKEVGYIKSITLQDKLTSKKTIVDTKNKKIVFATGGASYPLTGSDGMALDLLKGLGVSTNEFTPAIVPFNIVENDVCKAMQGIGLKNVETSLYVEGKKKLSLFGEVLFTHFGISGPCILTMSGQIYPLFKNNFAKIQESASKRNLVLKIDLKPALTNQMLEKRLFREFEGNGKKQIFSIMPHLFPVDVAKQVLKQANIPHDIQISQLSKTQRKDLINTIKGFELTIESFRTIKEAIISAGGVNTKKIDPKTMQSKQFQNLYFAGEIIDTFATTGGFNLQIAYSTAYLAGKK